MLTALEAVSINPSTLSCVFAGSTAPTITWYSGDVLIDSQATDDAFTEDPGKWEDNGVTSVLTINTELIADVTKVACKATFSDDAVTDPLETATNVHIRGNCDIVYTDFLRKSFYILRHDGH